jgi:hypothetical protein
MSAVQTWTGQRCQARQCFGSYRHSWYAALEHGGDVACLAVAAYVAASEWDIYFQKLTPMSARKQVEVRRKPDVIFFKDVMRKHAVGPLMVVEPPQVVALT